MDMERLLQILNKINEYDFIFHNKISFRFEIIRFKLKIVFRIQNLSTFLI